MTELWDDILIFDVNFTLHCLSYFFERNEKIFANSDVNKNFTKYRSSNIDNYLH